MKLTKTNTDTTDNRTWVSFKATKLTDTDTVEKLSTGAGFASFTYRSKGRGELARYTVNLGAKYGNILQRSIDLLNIKIQLGEFEGVEFEAANELLASWQKSIANGGSSNYTQKDTWEPVAHGIARHKENGTLKVNAMLESYVIIEKGEPKSEPKSDKAKAKAKIRKLFPIGKWVTLKFENVNFIRRNGETLVFSDTEKQAKEVAEPALA